MAQKVKEHVDHPAHYGGKDNPYERIKIAEAKYTPEALCGALRFNAEKYLDRGGKKDETIQDLKKARWYVDREIQYRERHKALITSLIQQLRELLDKRA